MWVVEGTEARGEGRVIGRTVKWFSVDGREEDANEEDWFLFCVRVVVIGDEDERSAKKNLKLPSTEPDLRTFSP